MAADDAEYERGLVERDYFSSVHEDGARRKREAELEPTSEVHTTHEASPSVPTSKTTTTAIHQRAPGGHRPDVNDKVLLFITDYKTSNHNKRGESHDGTKPQSITSTPQTLSVKGDNYSEISKMSIDETINEIELETVTSVETEEALAPHHSIKKSLEENSLAAQNENHGQEYLKHHVAARIGGPKKPSQGQGQISIKGGEAAATDNITPVLQVEAGPIFVHGPDDDDDETDINDPHPNNSSKRARALAFPKDSTQPKPNDSIRPENSKKLSIAQADSSSAGSNSSGEEREATSHDSTTTPSMPFIFQETLDVNTPLTPVTDNKTQTAAQLTGKPTQSETRTENPLDVQSLKPESSVTVITPEVSVAKAEKIDDDKRTEGEESDNIATSDLPMKPEAGHTEEPSIAAKSQRPREAENSDNRDSDMKTDDEGKTNEAQVESEKMDIKGSRSEESTQSPVPLQTMKSQQEGSTGSPLSSTKPTERPKVHGTPLLIAQIFKSIFG